MKWNICNSFIYEGVKVLDILEEVNCSFNSLLLYGQYLLSVDPLNCIHDRLNVVNCFVRDTDISGHGCCAYRVVTSKEISNADYLLMLFNTYEFVSVL